MPQQLLKRCMHYRVRQKVDPSPKVFRYFLSNRLKFYFEILRIYLLKPSTSNCQVKMWFCWKRRCYRLLTWLPTDFSAFKNVPVTTPI